MLFSTLFVSITFLAFWQFYHLFTKQLFGSFQIIFHIKKAKNHVDNVDNSVYKSISSLFRVYFMWISCERIKKWRFVFSWYSSFFCASWPTLIFIMNPPIMSSFFLFFYAKEKKKEIPFDISLHFPFMLEYSSYG